ncbi:aTPase/histidine kinase/DNA gyrase B/HSP90 domain protein [Firmicutes bacterium CAG:555]|nr:aTPase/histidine kinase/DNA gyrase B/HSP90 domain protein [Firmicutes bacterium CAG:555]
MHDTMLLTAALSMVDQPVAVSRKERIAFMNTAAITLAGRNLTGKPTALLIPSHIMNTQAQKFTATAFIGTKNCSVKVSTYEGTRIFVMVCNEQSPDDREALYANLRTTLSNIKFATSCMSIIAEDEGNIKLLEYGRSLNRSYYRMKRTLSNVTMLNAMARGEMPFNPEAVDVTALCKNMIDEVMSMDNMGVTIRFNAPEKIRVVADRTLLQQLLLNLLANSVSHCQHNGRIHVSLLRTDKNLIISVDDNGDGIRQDDLAYAFERYKHEIDFTKPQGAGMGLAVVRGIAELHKGAVIIESRGENMGTSVRVMLSLDIPLSEKMNSPRPDYEREDMRLILSELSYCLPLKSFSEVMED